MKDINSLYKQDLEYLYREISKLNDDRQKRGLTTDLQSNPHINLLIEAFSIVHSNLQICLNESISNFINQLFNRLYPHYLMPIPSIAMIQIELDKKVAKICALDQHQMLRLGSTNQSRFRTCYRHVVLPLAISGAYCRPVDEFLGNNIINKNILSVLNLEITSSNKLIFSKIFNSVNKKLRLFIAGFQNDKYLIYKSLLQNVVLLSISNAVEPTNEIFIDKDLLEPVGFTNSEDILPLVENTAIGYKIITEFFTCNDKFMFIDLDLSNINLTQPEFTCLNLKFYLDSKKLDDLINIDSFILNVVPVINLYSVDTEPIKVIFEQESYPIIADNNLIDQQEIHSVIKAELINDKNILLGKELFKENYLSKNNNSQYFWYITQRTHSNIANLPNKTSDSSISIFHKNGLVSDQDWHINLKVNCFDGNLPTQLYMQGDCKWQFVDHSIPMSQLKCLNRPQPVTYLTIDKEQSSRLIAHLSSLYINNINSNNAKSYICEILAMYNVKNNKINQQIIDNLLDAKILHTTKKVKIGKTIQFCQGYIIELYFDDRHIPDGLLFLFAKVFEQFIGIYCSINSFNQLMIKGNEDKIVFSGLPRNGARCVI